MAEIDTLVLREIRAMRTEINALNNIAVRAVELLGRVSDEIADVRADVVALRADVARVQGDVLLLQDQNRSLVDPVERVEHDPQPLILEHPDEDLTVETKGEGTVDEP